MHQRALQRLLHFGRKPARQEGEDRQQAPHASAKRWEDFGSRPVVMWFSVMGNACFIADRAR